MENIYIYLIIAFIICHIPVIRLAFCTVNTLVHESGHALMALLTSGKVYSISLFANTEGLAETGTSSWIARFLVSYAGYTTSSLVAFGSFYLIHTDNSHFLFYGLVGLALLNLTLWVRNIYGILWLSAFITLSFYFHYHQLSSWKEGFTLLIACILLIHSVSSAFTIFTLSITRPKHAGDATNLAQQTFIPAVFWGLLFFGQSLVSLYYVFTLFIL
ncbi:M50 family metallopeptidase [Bacillus alkalicellulosilyticus]|uniref:M50 family metallopeptidase n=1 Tax=Alkalihalobacterium alkalicellulosilyticum TaxID=1912214 RepID=UPI001483CA98|nr:M50 family metallopeptidase [Bacillus alkalicellulosilyticus]